MRELANEGSPRVLKAKPLFGEPVRKILRQPRVSLREKRNQAVLSIGTTRGFRAASITSIQIENIEFERRGVVIKLCEEKNAQKYEVVTTATPHTKDCVDCMPCILYNFVDLMHECGFTDGPLFRRIDRWGNIGPNRLTTKAVTQILRMELERAGVCEPQTYSSHSMRYGVVNDAVEKKWPIRDIMLLTGHRSERGLRAYLDGIDPWLTSCPRSLLDEPSPANAVPGRGWIHG
jgi:integrase